MKSWGIKMWKNLSESIKKRKQFWKWTIFAVMLLFKNTTESRLYRCNQAIRLSFNNLKQYLLVDQSMYSKQVARQYFSQTNKVKVKRQLLSSARQTCNWPRNSRWSENRHSLNTTCHSGRGNLPKYTLGNLNDIRQIRVSVSIPSDKCEKILSSFTLLLLSTGRFQALLTLTALYLKTYCLSMRRSWC